MYCEIYPLLEDNTEEFNFNSSLCRTTGQKSQNDVVQYFFLIKYIYFLNGEDKTKTSLRGLARYGHHMLATALKKF